MIGPSRIAREHMKHIPNDDLEMYSLCLISYRLEVYAQGINDFVKNMKVYPWEFYLTWTEFEPWTPYHSVCILVVLEYYISFDWFLELTRSKLTEIYDKEMVDRMMPYNEDFLYFNNTYGNTGFLLLIVISDEELKEMGKFDPNAGIYHFDPELLYYRKSNEPKKQFLHFEKEAWHQDKADIVSGQGIGSNCWVISGNHTKTGKPFLSCDPHLMKWL